MFPRILNSSYWRDAIMSPLHLAQYLVNTFGHVPGGVTPMKLQKLLYYVKSWSVVDGADLVDGAFLRWTHGPVNREVYDHFKSFGRAPLQPMTLASGQQPNGAEKEFIDFIGNSYARFPAITLSKMTHDEEPWRAAAPDSEIAASSMRSYYSGQPFARNLPFDPTGKPYVAVRSHMDRAFTLDMSPADAVRSGVYPSYAAYLERLKKAGYTTVDDWHSRLMS